MTFSARKQYLINAALSWQFYIGLILLFGYIGRSTGKVFCACVYLSSVISSHTSGMPLSHFYFTPFIVPFIYDAFKSPTVKTFSLLIVCFLTLHNPLARTLFLLENYLLSMPEVSAINHRKISNGEDLIEMSGCDPVFTNVHGRINCAYLNRPLDGMGHRYKSIVNYTELSFSQPLDASTNAGIAPLVP